VLHLSKAMFILQTILLFKDVIVSSIVIDSVNMYTRRAFPCTMSEKENVII